MSDPIERLQNIADKAERKLIEDFLALIARVGGPKLERRLISAIERKNIAEATRIVLDAYALELNPFSTRIANAVMEIQSKASDVTAETIGSAQLVGSFDMTNAQAVDFARRRGTQFAAQLDADTRKALRSIISSSFIQGIPPREIAQTIRQTLGLTSNQATAVGNYRRFLEGLGGRESLDALPQTVRERVRRSDIRMLPKRGSSMNEARIEKMTAKYRDRLLKVRATALMRTETIGAANQGQLSLWNRAVDADLITASKVRKKWIVTKDDRLCPICRALDGQLRKLDDAFVSPYNGASAQTPGIHWNCRCAMSLVRVNVRKRA